MARPKKYTVDNYDYSKICNLENCKRKIIVCEKCLKERNEIRLAHETRHLIPKSVKPNDPDVTIKKIADHAHFVLQKGTQAPAVDAGRNVRCEIRRERINKKRNTKTITVLIQDQNKPDWLQDELEE